MTIQGLLAFERSSRPPRQATYGTAVLYPTSTWSHPEQVCPPTLLGMLSLDTAVFLLVFAGSLWLAARSNKGGGVSQSLPPGPKPRPLVGNLFQVPRRSPWKQFAQWSKLYGLLIFLFISTGKSEKFRRSRPPEHGWPLSHHSEQCTSRQRSARSPLCHILRSPSLPSHGSVSIYGSLMPRLCI